jgi:hypothetical protein
MPATYALAQVACNTAVAAQAIPVDLGGQTPKAAILWGTYALVNGTIATHSAFMFGAAGQTGQAAQGSRSQNKTSGATTTHYIGHPTTYCYTSVITSSSAQDSAARLVSFGADVVNINWDDFPASAYLLNVLAIAGNDVQSKAGTIEGITTTPQLYNVGFSPQVVITFGGPFLSGSGRNTAQRTIGFSVNDPSLTQISNSHSDPTAQSTSVPVSRLSTLNAWNAAHANGATAAITAFDPVGFFAKRGTTSISNFGYLALNLGDDALFNASVIQTPTADGNKEYDWPGFRPKVLLHASTKATVLDNINSDSTVESYGLGICTPDAALSASVWTQDNVSAETTRCVTKQNAATNLESDSATKNNWSLVAMTPTGYIIDSTETDTTERNWPALAIGSVPRPRYRHQGAVL